MPHVRVRVCLLLLPALLAGCAGGGAHHRSPSLTRHAPQRVALLPFVITMTYHGERAKALPDDHLLGRDILRQTFYHNLAMLGYDDVSLAAVDDALASFGPAWLSATPQALGQRLRVDAVIEGDITRIQSSSTLVYTGTAIEATFRMVDTRTGETLWRTRVKEAEQGGLLMQKGQAADFLKDQKRSHDVAAMFQRASDVIVRRALRKLPDPARTAAQAREAARAAPTATRPRLAMLPFTAQHTTWLEAAHQMRQIVGATLHEGTFDVIELRDVEAVAQELWGEGAPTADQLQRLARELDADLLLAGQATKLGRAYLVVHSQVDAGLGLSLIDPKTGTAIWEDAEQRTRRAGLLKLPTGYVAVALSPLKGIQGRHLKRVQTHVARELAQAMIQAPEVQQYLQTRRAQR
ncbi:MAG: hypothetical protein HY597_04110 [Candidatus Omnitrophica bacterium]|nr:hypothetical protein [Candidatus Omnitrophota bacterium]